MKISEVARATGLTPRALRYYEELGLLAPPKRLVGGHRTYDAADVSRATRIRQLQQLGTPLAQIPQLLDDGAVGAVLAGQLHRLDRQIWQLARARERLAHCSDAADLPELLDALEHRRDVVQRRITLLVYADLEAAHDFLVSVFGFAPGPLTYDDDGIAVHGVVIAGDGQVWLHPESQEARLSSPRHLGGSTHCMAIFVDDVDEHHAMTGAAGAQIVTPPRDMPYGVREYDVRDCEGAHWSFMSELEHEPTEGEEPS